MKEEGIVAIVKERVDRGVSRGERGTIAEDEVDEIVTEVRRI